MRTRKRSIYFGIQQLEQRRLLSGVIIKFEYLGDMDLTAPVLTTGDLGIDTATIYGTPVAGQSLTVAPEVIRTGGMQSMGWGVVAELSTDSVWGGSDGIFLGPILNSDLNSYGSVTIPSYVTPGNYQLLLRVHPTAINGQTIPTDTNPTDDVFDAGTINVQAANSSSPTPVINDDALVGGSLDASTAAAGSFVEVVPQVVRSGTFWSDDYNVQVVLSTDGVLGNGDDIPLTNANPTSPPPFDFDPSNGDPNVTGDFNYDGVVNADDYALFQLGSNSTGSPGSPAPTDAPGEEGGSNTVTATNPLTGSGLSQWNTFHSGEMQIPSTVAPGTYQVLMQVSPYDGSNTVAADNYPADDFLDAGTLIVTPYVAPSIQITGATFPATAPAGNSVINVEPTVVETGALTNVDYNISVQLSTTGTWNNSAGMLSSDPDNNTDPNAPIHGGDFDIPGDSTAPGTYQLLVQATPLVGSWDEYLSSITTGNTATYNAGTITITPNDSANLGVTAVSIPTTVAAGSSIDLEPTVVEQGLLANELYVIRPVLSTDNIFGNADDIPLKTLSIPFQSGEAQVPSITPPGTYQLLLQIGEATSGPVDTDPSDDVLDAGTLTVTPDESPDMAVTSIATLPKTVIQGSTIDIEPTIFSSGSLAGADYNITVALSRNDLWGDSDDIVVAGSTSGSSNAPFHSGEVTIPADLEYGYYVLVHITPWTATLDPNNPLPTDADPTDDTFNAGLISVNPPPPDDGVIGATFPATAEAWTNIDVEPTVVQTGSLANDNYQISVSLSTDTTWGNADDIVLWPNPISVNPYHSGGMDIPGTVVPGIYQLLVHIAPWSSNGSASFPTDTNPSDDVVDAGTITITSYTPPPVTTNPPVTGNSPPATGDLGVTSATFPSSTAAGSNIDVEPTVIETGAFSDYNITVELSTDGIWGDSGNIELSPPPNPWIYATPQSFHSGNLAVPSTLPAGNYQILVQIAPWQSTYSIAGWPFGSSSTPTDTDPGDDEVNAGTITITPYLAPDLGISSATFPSTAAAGTSIDIEPTIIRVGGFENYDYSVTAVLSQDDTLGNNDDISLMQSSSSSFGDLNYDGTLNFPYHSGNLTIPSNVAPGIYHLFLSVAESDELSVVIPDSTLPTDSNPADNTLDAGTITVTANPSTVNPGGPIQNPTPITETPPGNTFHLPSSPSGKYSALYLSTNATLDVPRGSSSKLLKLGASVTLGTPDAKLKMGANQSSAIPQNTAPGVYYLLATTKNGSQVLDVGTVMVDAGAPQVQAVVHPKMNSVTVGTVGLVNLTFRNTGSVAANDLPVSLYLSTDQNYSDNNTQLIAGALSMVTIAPRASFSNSYVTEFPATIAADKYYILACTDVDGTINVVGVSPKTISVS